MILELCGEIVLRVVGSVVSGVVNAVVSRTGDPEGDEPRVSPNALAERRYAYRRWAERSGFARDERWSDLHRGERVGHRIRFYTGVAGERPRPPELFIEHPMEGIASTVILTLEQPAPGGVDPALGAVLQHDGVLRIELEAKGVRIVFVPMVPADLLDAPLDEMLRALAPRETHAYRRSV
ncbi:MAG: hypothetical protein JST00_40725 [Deltaproteobacteria bacterium]|nr:hypothetical protein [Deltaproteobacteria bacterium]